MPVIARVPGPEDTFYVVMYTEDGGTFKDGSKWSYSMYVPPLPADLISGKGVLVSNGVVKESVEKIPPLGLCNKFGLKCREAERKMTGSYGGGRLRVEFRTDKEYVFDGSPIHSAKGPPVQPGRVSTFDTILIEGSVQDERLESFAGTVERKHIEGYVQYCARWKEGKEKGECELDGYRAAPVKTESYTWKGWVAAPRDATAPPEKVRGTAVVSEVKGEVEVKRGVDKDFVPANVGHVLRFGDQIGTGYGSSAKVDFGYGHLKIDQLTQIRVDEFTSKDNLAKTQLYLRVGAIEADLPHKAAIRSDFSVCTPTACSSIRGSRMRVGFDEKTKETLVTVLEDKAYVKGVNDAAEIEVAEGGSVRVSGDGKTGQPMKGGSSPGQPESQQGFPGGSSVSRSGAPSQGVSGAEPVASASSGGSPSGVSSGGGQVSGGAGLIVIAVLVVLGVIVWFLWPGKK